MGPEYTFHQGTLTFRNGFTALWNEHDGSPSYKDTVTLSPEKQQYLRKALLAMNEFFADDGVTPLLTAVDFDNDNQRITYTFSDCDVDWIPSVITTVVRHLQLETQVELDSLEIDEPTKFTFPSDDNGTTTYTVLLA